MNSRTLLFPLLLLLLGFAGKITAQGVSDPLTIQGLDNARVMDARSQGMGGTAVASGTNASAVFSNPAAISLLADPEFRIGGYITSLHQEQTQNWIPNRFYADLSLMFENLLGGIKDPDNVINPVDKLHKPFDDITPAWDRTRSHARPSVLAAAYPFAVDGVELVAGFGYAEMINLDHYFQNNNAIDPPVGSYRTNSLPLVNVGDSLKIEWFRFIRQRDGGLRGYTPALSARLTENLHVGLSATFLNGWSDDREERLERGLLTMFYNTYRLDSVYRSSVSTGSSHYTGTIPTIGVLYDEEYYTAGLTLRLPATITRDWTRRAATTTSAGTAVTHSGGSDDIALPVTYALGLSLHPSEDVDISVDYDVRNLSQAEYTPAGGTPTSPWLTGKSLRVGGEYRMMRWLSLRAGARGETMAFAAAGDGLLSEPVTGTTYTGGIGLVFGPISVDVAYELTWLSYQDMYASNINFNSARTHTGLLEIGFVY